MTVIAHSCAFALRELLSRDCGDADHSLRPTVFTAVLYGIGQKLPKTENISPIAPDAGILRAVGPFVDPAYWHSGPSSSVTKFTKFIKFTVGVSALSY
jgi:hypothetical protein